MKARDHNRRVCYRAMRNPGSQLRRLRESLGFRLVDVEAATGEIARYLQDPDYSIPSSTLSDIETKSVVPTLFRFISLSLVYRTDHAALFGFFGIDLSRASDVRLPPPPLTALTAQAAPPAVLLPTMDPGFDTRKSSDVGRLIERWGLVPISKLQRFARTQFVYGYVGEEDRTMYPLLLPGTFVQVDPAQTDITPGPWRSEYERPIYFLQTRDESFCSWCSLLDEGHLVVQPHPLSGVSPRRFSLERDVDVVGRVVGIAMQLVAP